MALEFIHSVEYLANAAHETGFALSQAEMGILPFVSQLLPAVDVSGDGYAVRVTWQPVYGATRAEVAQARVQVGVAVVEENLGDLALAASGSAYVVTIPGGKRIASLTLHSMKDAANNPISSQATLPTAPEQHRLVVQTQTGNQADAPIHAIPSVPARGMIPRSLTGASFSSSVLSLPNVAAPKLRLSLVTKSFPEEFQEQSFALARVSGVAAVYPTDLQLVDPTGVVVWAFPGEYPPANPPFEIDLRVNLEPALNAALKAAPAAPLDVSFHLKGKPPGKAGFRFGGAHGALVREFPGQSVMSVELEGDPVALPIADRLADERPSSVTAGLTVTYNGIRILEDLSDQLPAGAVGGVVVGPDAVLRAYPPQAFTNVQLARIGLLGRVPLDVAECELAVQLVRVVADRAAETLGAPQTLAIPTERAIRTHWLALPPGIDLSGGNVGLSVRATRGRFLWAAEQGRPLAKLAIYDPLPGGRPLGLNGAPTYAVAVAEQQHMPQHAFDALAFCSSAPVFDSVLFLTVDVSDLTLRYAR